jgi:hypothetical protein
MSLINLKIRATHVDLVFGFIHYLESPILGPMLHRLQVG